MDKFDENNFRTDEGGTSDSWISNMKTSPYFECCICCSRLYSTTNVGMAEKYKISIVDHIHKCIFNMSAIKQKLKVHKWRSTVS